MSRPIPMVKPLSIAIIESKAIAILNKHSPATLDGRQPFDILRYIDGPLFDEFEVDFDVQDLGPSVEGRLDGKVLVLNTPVYDGMLKKQGRARFTGAHETGHAVLHAGQLASMNDGARGTPVLFRRDQIRPYENPEWQADTFGAAILMPASGVERVLAGLRSASLDSKTLAVASAFLVSRQAAEVRIKKLAERGQISK